MESASARILTGHTQACEVDLAVRELHAQISQPDAALVVVFCSTAYPRPVLAEALQHHFGDVPMIGCTTAGELGASGYQTGGITGFSLPAAEFTVATARLDGLDDVSLDAGQHCVDALLAQMPAVTDGQERFALLLVDGLAQREEPVAYALQRALGRTPLVGGSAGDGLHFGRSWVYHDGAFHTRSAVLALVSTRRRSRVFKTQHFTHDKERLVVTEADPKRRRVFELNGLPAAARLPRLTEIVHRLTGGNPPRDDISIAQIALTDTPNPVPAAPSGELQAPFTASDWRLVLRLGATDLKRLDAVPLILGAIEQFEGVRPFAGRLFLVLSELFNNALDHGLLRLPSSLKVGSEGMDVFLEERSRRLARLAVGAVEFELTLRQSLDRAPMLHIGCVDTGPGFDHEQQVAEAMREPTTEEMLKGHGRGIPLLLRVCEEVRYSGSGNRVDVVFRLAERGADGLK